jgi:hypothetical protein
VLVVRWQSEIAFHTDCDSLADSPEFAHDATLNISNGRPRGSKQKGACQAHSLDRLRDDARFECADLGGNIGELRHASQLASRNPLLQLGRIEQRLCGERKEGLTPRDFATVL